MGFIGVGTQGRGLLGGFLNYSEVQVVAVCDVDTTRREHSKKTVEDFYAKKKLMQKRVISFFRFRFCLGDRLSAEYFVGAGI
jgi:hypothetical protein